MMESGGITCAVCGRPVAVPYRSDHEPRLVEEEAQDADE